MQTKATRLERLAMITDTLVLTVSKHRNSKGQTLQEKAAHTGTATQWTSLMICCRSEVCANE